MFLINIYTSDVSVIFKKHLYNFTHCIKRWKQINKHHKKNICNIAFSLCYLFEQIVVEVELVQERKKKKEKDGNNYYKRQSYVC
jgi:hypothetical protein